MAKSITEVELKIKMSKVNLDRLFKAFKIKSKAKFENKYYPRFYYDTSNLDLHQRGISLRIQYKPGKHGQMGAYEQTLKYEAKGSKNSGQPGVMVRKECKDVVLSPRPDLKRITDKGAKKFFKGIKNKDLCHIFTAAIERRMAIVKVKPAMTKWGRVEIAFDSGYLMLPAPYNREKAMAEVELEIKSGGFEHIEALKTKILKMMPGAQVHTMAKSDQGIAFFLQAQKSHKNTVKSKGKSNVVSLKPRRSI